MDGHYKKKSLDNLLSVTLNCNIFSVKMLLVDKKSRN